MSSSPMVSGVRFTQPSVAAARLGLVALASFDHGLLRVHGVEIRRLHCGALVVPFPFPDHRNGPGALSRPITEAARRAVEADLLAELVRQAWGSDATAGPTGPAHHSRLEPAAGTNPPADSTTPDPEIHHG